MTRKIEKNRQSRGLHNMPSEQDVYQAFEARLRSLGAIRGVPIANTAGASEAMNKLRGDLKSLNAT